VIGTVSLNIAQQLQLVLSPRLLMHLLSLSEFVMATGISMLMLVAKARWQISCPNNNHHCFDYFFNQY